MYRRVSAILALSLPVVLVLWCVWSGIEWHWQGRPTTGTFDRLEILVGHIVGFLCTWWATLQHSQLFRIATTPTKPKGPTRF